MSNNCTKGDKLSSSTYAQARKALVTLYAAIAQLETARFRLRNTSVELFELEQSTIDVDYVESRIQLWLEVCNPLTNFLAEDLALFAKQNFIKELNP